jgi:hypothetical protein
MTGHRDYHPHSGVSFESRIYPREWCYDKDDKMATTTTSIVSNQKLVQQRLAIQRGKAKAQEQTIQARADKNYRLKRLIHSDMASNFSLSTNDTATTSENLNKKNARQSPSDMNNNTNMYAIKVWAEPNFRQELKLSGGREKRG